MRLEQITQERDHRVGRPLCEVVLCTFDRPESHLQTKTESSGTKAPCRPIRRRWFGRRRRRRAWGPRPTCRDTARRRRNRRIGEVAGKRPGSRPGYRLGDCLTILALSRPKADGPPRFPKGVRWWARLGLNQRPLRCQHSALPLSYAPSDV